MYKRINFTDIISEFFKRIKTAFRIVEEIINNRSLDINIRFNVENAVFNNIITFTDKINDVIIIVKVLDEYIKRNEKFRQDLRSCIVFSEIITEKINPENRFNKR